MEIGSRGKTHLYCKSFALAAVHPDRIIRGQDVCATSQILLKTNRQKYLKSTRTLTDFG
jgi:hypothetical protein